MGERGKRDKKDRSQKWFKENKKIRGMLDRRLKREKGKNEKKKKTFRKLGKDGEEVRAE